MSPISRLVVYDGVVFRRPESGLQAVMGICGRRSSDGFGAPMLRAPVAHAMPGSYSMRVWPANFEASPTAVAAA